MAPSISHEPIAVVGSSCRFAGDASSPSKLWELLENPRDLNQEIPNSRFNVNGWYHPDSSYHGHSNVKNAYLVNEDVAAFDAEFFGIKSVEAKTMDPQQRFLMEVAYEGLESAGMAIADLRNSDTAVFVGVMFADYGAMLLRDLQETPTYYATGTGNSILSNRLSYFFDWHGPSITIDTACSSSMVAVHMAVQALRSGDSRMALACGSNLILGPENFIIESKLKMLSPNGLSRMWDQGADGYARGDGTATVVLKTLSAALEDGDHIECIIRETSLNQDGATSGITMPSASAQEALIRSTYAKAGLDLLSPKDRPQYFEAHGTGTPAGDPIEAEAVYNSFSTSHQGETPLYVGSIKTVLGHTEGTAGVAAILKASLALQHGTIPPNLLFDQLSEGVAPFYKNVEIAKVAKPWPACETKRASVNSFGFGGANAHAILESYNNDQSSLPSEESAAPVTPYVFSAFSESSLRAGLSAFVDFLDVRDPKISARDLAYTLRERRTAFPYRVSVPASSLDDLKSKIAAKLGEEDTSIGIKALPNSKKGIAKLLGIFTGQGAQYPRMGAELIEGSDTAQAIIQQLESDLAQLPDGPEWSLKAEIFAGASSSKVHEAAISQPLCTAVQILLVDLLRLAGVEFHAVVGHSSGEIAAAYAAGYLSSRDAIFIAYYRGMHLKLAASQNGSDKKGAMLAVGSSMADMLEICADEQFQGRIAVAANNSSSSVTISGDEDAIEELQLLLEDERKFNRRLRVDRAYHSHHMLPCFEPYIESLRQCGITPLKSQGNCAFISTVYNRPISSDMQLADRYWAENMTKAVLFSDAVALATTNSAYDLVLEVGSHPALKGPASQTVQEVTGKEVPYSGVLARGTSSIEAFSASLGFLWSHLDKSQIDLGKYQRAMTNDTQPFSVVKGLPKYQWNHKVRYWQESRASRKMRLREQLVHSLLGDISSDSAAHHMTWKHLLRESEMPWLSGHQVQSQTVFPAAGYISSAMEAARALAQDTGKDIRLIEIRDFTIHQAVVFDQDDAGIEVLIQLADITRDTDRIRARFTYAASLDSNTDDLTLAASGDVQIILGQASLSLLPARNAALSHVIDVETERFYQALADLGYDFSGRFKSLSSLQRKYHKATCLVKLQPLDHGADSLLIHPAELDAALQSVILAYSYPYDEQLRTLHLPTTIKQIRINPALLGAGDRTEDEFVPVDSAIADREVGRRGITGNVDLYSNRGPNVAIQVQGANFMPLGGSAAAEDRRVFSKVHWVNSHVDGDLAARDIPIGEKHVQMVMLLERIATFYLRQFDKLVAKDDPLRTEFPTNWYLNYARYVTDMVETGRHKWAQKEWLNDTLEDVLELSKPWSETPDVQIMHLTGSQMPRVFKGETTILEQFRANDLLDRYYANGFGLSESAQWVSRAVKQIVDRYPHMSVMEIGAGTGGATKSIFREIGNTFKSYTYTDISAAFFENAAAIFPKQRDRMIFKTFDAEKEPTEQGFVDGSYDLIVAFFVIHATGDLERALKHIRRLLKPGGFLVVGEGQEGMNGVASSGFIFGTLPGWWFGADKGRTYSPHVSPKEWDELLKKTGFSGVDSATPPPFEDVLNVYHFVSRAVDEETNYFRDPLAVTTKWKAPPIKKLVVIGGETSRSSHLVKGLLQIMKGDFAAETYHFKNLLDVDHAIVDANSTIVSLTELDSPVFKDITPERFDSLRKVFESEKTILWVTSGRRDDEPYSNMTVGFGRVAANETPELRLQHLDIAEPENTKPETIAEILLRLHASAFTKNERLQPVEPEIVIDDKQKELVSRLRPIPELNNRYNSISRTIEHDVDIKQSPVSLELTSSGCVFKKLSKYDTSGSVEDTIELHITHAVLSALKTPYGHKFLVLGLTAETEATYLALVPSLASVLKVPSKSAVRTEIALESAGVLLNTTASHLISMTVVDPLYSGQTLVAHNANSALAQALAAQGGAKNVTVVYTVDVTDDDTPESWIKLPRYATQPELSEIILETPSSFVGFSSGSIETSENESTMIENLPADCHVATAKSLYSTTGSESNYYTSEPLGDRLRLALKYSMNGISKENHASLSIQSATLETLATSTINDPLTIVDFTATSTLPVQVTRLDASPMFKGKSSTYWIVGMSGALGISLCDWMITRGARNIVLTTRNPKVEPEWIAAHKRKGATVTILPCDVTNESALKVVHQQICDTLPPIVGAMQGAMVLRDVSLRNMSFEELNDVIRPKVNGSIYLDRIFYNVNLDFFILISSINCVIGNMGQANYAAANTFMCSLAAQRRKRGLRAATVNAGAIVGAGYMERESRRALDVIVQKLHMMRMSEEDWTQAISEAIDASRLESSHGPEITTGLSDVPFDTPNAPNWFLNPKFSSFIVQQGAAAEDKNEGKASASVSERLRTCETQKEVCTVVEQAFAAQLRKVLQMSMSDSELMDSRSSDLGLDSLVSVDVRSWFLKNLQVNIPVLKIMGNESMVNIVQFAVDNIPAELVPMIASDEPDSNSDSDSPEKGTDGSQLSTHPTTPDRNGSPVYSITHPASKNETQDISSIDWDVESRPSADLADIPRVLDNPVSAIPKVIVLTGVSGLLGHNLLDYLLEHTEAKIVCIAVRNLAARLQKKELRIDHRVEYYGGELAAPSLGLSEQAAASIFAQADVVIHNGSDTSHLKFFPDMRAANVGSTRALTRFCLPRRIPMHYISSVGVCVLYNKPDFPEVSVTGPGSLQPASDGAFGYMCSKWTNERFLEQVHQLYGLKVCIHRPSTIIRQGEDAKTAKAQLDWVNAMLHYTRQIKAAPKVEYNRGAMDLVYVESACDDILYHIMDNSERAQKEVTYVHEVGDIVIPMNALQNIGKDAEGKGKPFELLPMNEWVTKAVEAGLHPAVAALIEMMDTPGAPDYPKLGKVAHP